MSTSVEVLENKRLEEQVARKIKYLVESISGDEKCYRVRPPLSGVVLCE